MTASSTESCPTARTGVITSYSIHYTKLYEGTSSAFAERITGGFYLNIEPDRTQLARYGLSVGEVQVV